MLAAARALVVKYLDDVNAQNRTAAKSLICDALVFRPLRRAINPTVSSSCPLPEQ